MRRAAGFGAGLVLAESLLDVGAALAAPPSPHVRHYVSRVQMIALDAKRGRAKLVRRYERVRKRGLETAFTPPFGARFAAAVALAAEGRRIGRSQTIRI